MAATDPPGDRPDHFRWVGAGPAPGCLLVATPVLTDPSFAHTVLYVLEHDAGGTAAVILNRATHTPVGQVLPDWQDAVSHPAVIFAGGPVQPDGALCLGWLRAAAAVESGLDPALDPATDPASTEAVEASSMTDPNQSAARSRPTVRPVVGSICTVDLDGPVEEVIDSTSGLRVFAGHAGWSPGQLEDELAEGAWFVVPGRPSDVFALDPQRLRGEVLRRQPAPLSLLSTYPLDVSVN